MLLTPQTPGNTDLSDAPKTVSVSFIASYRAIASRCIMAFAVVSDAGLEFLVEAELQPQIVAASAKCRVGLGRVSKPNLPEELQKAMPRQLAEDDIDLIIEDVGRGGGGKPPSSDGGDDGEGHNRRRDPERPPYQRRYYIAVIIAIVAVLMFFMALAGAFIVRRGSSADWIPIHLPPILWVNTVLLLASSATLELARRKLARGELSAFHNLWILTTVLGAAFLAGQFVAWRLLEAQGVFLASNPASSFFYIFTGAHAVHLFGGVAVLLYVAARKFEKSRISRVAAAEVASYYWHFMDALWVFLLALIYVGK